MSSRRADIHTNTGQVDFVLFNKASPGSRKEDAPALILTAVHVVIQRANQPLQAFHSAKVPCD